MDHKYNNQEAMIRNYIKIAIAVLMRRKFFTFISLFGISFTLTILMVLTAFMDVMFSPVYPDVNRNKELFIDRIELKSAKQDYQYISTCSFYFMNNFVAKMKIPQKIAFHTNQSTVNAYQHNKKISIALIYTNVAFWEVYQFLFLEGKPFSQQELDNGTSAVVISEDTRNDYFGTGVAALGKYIAANNTSYRVVGVVKNVPATNVYTTGGMYLPYSLSKENLTGTELGGSFHATLLAASAAELPLIQEEYQQLLKRVPHPAKNQELLFSYADNYLESRTRAYFMNDRHSGTRNFYLVVGGFVFLFMLLPTINLVNINISRIMERSSEIGVRKAFGASRRSLIGQFLVENMILTLIGGVLGVLFSLITIRILNLSGLITNLDLSMNLTVLSYSLLACLVFGLMSGVYPAWRMSKLNVITALKANN